VLSSQKVGLGIEEFQERVERFIRDLELFTYEQQLDVVTLSDLGEKNKNKQTNKKKKTTIFIERICFKISCNSD